MKLKQYAAVAAVSLMTICLWGCKSPSKGNQAVEPSPSPSPPLRMGTVIDSPTFALSDKSGKPVTKISAESGAATGSNETDALGELKKATAELYQNGKLTAILTADKLKVDAKTRILTAQGNVLVESHDTLGEKKTVRSDTVRWEYDRDKIVGSGNVLLQQGELVRIPAANFVADTALKKCDLNNDGSPITGTY